ncbi:hypothetical protein TNCV_468501 [Trichonephila clavipes]|nr:hypothetical protein TNCV_468501 [Trichonephila clavipes]
MGYTVCDKCTDYPWTITVAIYVVMSSNTALYPLHGQVTLLQSLRTPIAPPPRMLLADSWSNVLTVAGLSSRLMWPVSEKQCRVACRQSPDNTRSVDFSQRANSLRLIEDETFNDSDIINNLLGYEDGQEEPDFLRAVKIYAGEYCEDDDLLILPAGLGPDKSRQDDLKYCKIREETNGMNFNNFFFRTSDCIENDTTMEDDSFRQESPVNTSRETFLFPEFDLNKFSSLESFLECFDKQCLEYQKRRTMEKAKFEWDDDEEFFSSPEKFTPFSSLTR